MTKDYKGLYFALKKEYEELSKEVDKYQDFYNEHENKNCEVLVKEIYNLRKKFESEQKEHYWTLKYLFFMIYVVQIDKERYERLCKEYYKDDYESEIMSYNVIKYHLESNAMYDRLLKEFFPDFD